MRNQRSYSRAWPFSRWSLRFERLEHRLPFAVDGITVETGYWLASTYESPMFLAEQWIAMQDEITDIAIIGRSTEPVPVDVVFSLPEIFETPQLLLDVPYFDTGLLTPPDTLFPTSDAIVAEVFPVAIEASESRILEQIIARNLPVFELNTDQPDAAVPSNDLWISTNILRTSALPLDRFVIEGPAMPVQEIGSSSIEGKSVRVSNVTTGQSDTIERADLSKSPRSNTSDLLSANNPSAKLERAIPKNITTIEVPNYRESPRNESRVNQERAWPTNANSESSMIGTFHTTHELAYLSQQQSSLDQILRDSGTEPETDSRLTTGKENSKQTENRPTPYDDFGIGTKIEITHANAKLPIRSIPEGMLPIGSEISIKEYNRGRNLKLHEDFVAQTALICDDLSSTVLTADDSKEQLEESVYHTYVPEKIYWVAIGSTLIVTHVSLNHRKSSDSVLVEWIVRKLPKFKKHNTN